MSDLDGTWQLCGKVEGIEEAPLAGSFKLKEFQLQILKDNPTYKMSLKVSEEGFTVEDSFDDQSFVTEAKFGEEYENPLCSKTNF